LQLRFARETSADCQRQPRARIDIERLAARADAACDCLLGLDLLEKQRDVARHDACESTASYAHVRRDPSLEAATRIEELLVAAVEGKIVNAREGDAAEAAPEVDTNLMGVLAERLSKERLDTTRLSIDSSPGSYTRYVTPPIGFDRAEPV
jgi:hypothetical protein